SRHRTLPAASKHDVVCNSWKMNCVPAHMQLRYAIRTLAKTPGFVLVAVLSLALGIGINTVVFSTYQAVAMKPLSISRPAEIVRIVGRYAGPEIDRFSYAAYERLRKETRRLPSIAATP